MGIDTGFYLINNLVTRQHYAVNITDTFVQLSVFEHFEDPVDLADNDLETIESIQAYLNALVQNMRTNLEMISWAEFKPQYIDSGTFNPGGGVDKRGFGIYIPDLPNTTRGGVYRGTSTIYSDGMTGLDEIVDFSLIDIMVGSDGSPLPWRNRFAQTSNEKVEYSFRHRARESAGNALVIFMPFEKRFTDCRIELLCQLDPILLDTTSVTAEVDDTTIPKDGLWFKNFYWNAKQITSNITVPAGGTVDVPFEIVWNNGSGRCDVTTKLKLDCDAGYLPKRRATTTSGLGSFKASALGLSAGDEMNVKISAEHYTAIGKVNIQVT